VLAADAAERFANSSVIELVTTDTLPLPPEKRWPGLTVLSVATLLSEVIQRIHSGVSVDHIFHRRNPALS
jgi:ribose-phosphate pyrophosphokinase